MSRARETFGKKETRIKKEKKRKEKEAKRIERKDKQSTSFEDMIAYVDELGNITATPPDPLQRTNIKAEDINIGVRRSEDADPADFIRIGVVTFFDSTKGYGFIKDSETRQDVFVHVNGLAEPIKENNKVSYEVVKGLKGLNAVNVKIVRE